MMHRARVFLLGLHLAFVHAIPIDDYNFLPVVNKPNPGSIFGDNPSPNPGNIPFLTSLLPSSPPPQAPNSFFPVPQASSNRVPSFPSLFSIVPQREQASVVPQNQGSFQILNTETDPVPSESLGPNGFFYRLPSESASQEAPVTGWVFDPQDYDCSTPDTPLLKLFLGCCDKTDRTVFTTNGDDEYESCVAGMFVFLFPHRKKKKENTSAGVVFFFFST